MQIDVFNNSELKKIDSSYYSINTENSSPKPRSPQYFSIEYYIFFSLWVIIVCFYWQLFIDLAGPSTVAENTV